MYVYVKDVALQKQEPLTPRAAHLLTMKATDIANNKNWAEMAEKFGWTFMYIPAKGYTQPPQIKNVNPWRI